jgi:hypothetical protein
VRALTVRTASLRHTSKTLVFGKTIRGGDVSIAHQRVALSLLVSTTARAPRRLRRIPVH